MCPLEILGHGLLYSEIYVLLWKLKFFSVEVGRAAGKMRELEERKPIKFEAFILESFHTTPF